MSPNYFVLTVNRENLVDSTVSQLVQSDQNNFKKPLRVRSLLDGCRETVCGGHPWLSKSYSWSSKSYSWLSKSYSLLDAHIAVIEMV